MFGHGNADGAGRELGCDWVESMEAGTDAVDRTLVSGGHAMRIEGDGGRADTVDVGPGDGVGKVGEVVSEASEGVAELDMLSRAVSVSWMTCWRRCGERWVGLWFGWTSSMRLRVLMLLVALKVGVGCGRDSHGA